MKKHPDYVPPVDDEIIEVITTDGQRIPVAIRRDVQEINPATGERRFVRTTSLLPDANGTPIPEKPQLGRCQVCGRFPLNREDIRRCAECERKFGIECIGVHAPGPENTVLYLCVDCERGARRQALLRYFFSLG